MLPVLSPNSLNFDVWSGNPISDISRIFPLFSRETRVFNNFRFWNHEIHTKLCIFNRVQRSEWHGSWPVYMDMIQAGPHPRRYRRALVTLAILKGKMEGERERRIYLNCPDVWMGYVMFDVHIALRGFMGTFDHMCYDTHTYPFLLAIEESWWFFPSLSLRVFIQRKFSRDREKWVVKSFTDSFYKCFFFLRVIS